MSQIYSKKGPVVGTTTNDSANAGEVGEYIESVGGTAVYGGATGEYSDLTTISLTAGDWDVSAIASFYNANAAGLVEVLIGVSKGTAGNTFSDRTDGQNVNYSNIVAGNGLVDTRTVPPFRISLAATTTIILKAELQFSGGTPQCQGYRISARRVR